LPFGKGLEIGFHLEGPYQLNAKNVSLEYIGPVLLEFDGRFGFKDKPIGEGLLHHNLGIGWTIGPWIDNGWYAEYAAGWEYQWVIPYANFRTEWLATDFSSIDSLTESYSPYNYEKRSWTTRTAIGISMRIPHWWITPDFIVPEIAVIYPHYSAVSHYGIGLSYCAEVAEWNLNKDRVFFLIVLYIVMGNSTFALEKDSSGIVVKAQKEDQSQNSRSLSPPSGI